MVLARGLEDWGKERAAYSAVTAPSESERGAGFDACVCGGCELDCLDGDRGEKGGCEGEETHSDEVGCYGVREAWEFGQCDGDEREIELMEEEEEWS